MLEPTTLVEPTAPDVQSGGPVPQPNRSIDAKSKGQRQSQLRYLKELRQFIITRSSWTIRKDQMFGALIRASLSKSYEFCLEAHKPSKRDSAFFLAASLRSICEDLIILAYMTRMKRDDRERLTTLLMQHELAARLKSQSTFFKVARPDQPILSPDHLRGMKSIELIENDIRSIWIANGWPRLNKAWMPSTRQIAEKYHLNLLTTLYEYIFRLTSATVHFNPQSLLRSGWGTETKTNFSPRNFNGYYEAYIRTYSTLLFCFYFELFGRFIRADADTKRIVTDMRELLLSEARWPEMVTYEEMNLSPPRGVEILRIAYRLVDAERRKQGLLNYS